MCVWQEDRKSLNICRSSLEMEKQLLKADELVEQQSNRNATLPSLGDKYNHPKESQRELEEIQTKLLSVKSLISRPLVSQIAQMSEATWDISKGMAIVNKQCGKHWDVMGHFRDDTLYLRPEEALFMLESNALEIKLNQLPMSIQQSYEVMLGSQCTLDEYRTYAHFYRQGYKIIRHQGDLGISKYEGQIKLDQYRRKKRKPGALNEKKGSKVPKVIDLVEEVYDNDIGGGGESNCKDVIDVDEDDIVTIHDDVDVNDVKARGAKKYFQDISTFFGQRNVSVKTPPTDLLPFRTWPSKKIYDLVIHDENGLSIARKSANMRKDRFGLISAGTSTPPSPSPPSTLPTDCSITALNRPFYQKYTPKHKGKRSKGRKVKGNSKWNLAITIENEPPEVITLSDDEPDPSQILREGPLHTLWTSTTTPLLRPLDAKTTRSVLNKLQLKTKASVESFSPVTHRISFDVYHPNVQNFRKSAPRLPNFRVIIAQKEERVPNVEDLQCTLGTIKDQVPIIFALPSESDIAFYSPYPISLPFDITMG